MPRAAVPVSRSRLAVRAGLAAVAFAVAAPGTSLAATVFQPSSPLSSPGHGPAGTSVALDASGGGVAVWSLSSGAASAGTPGASSVHASVRTAGGAFGTPQTLSGPDAVIADAPRVAVNARGDATVIWTEDEGPSVSVIKAVTRPAGGTFGQPQSISDAHRSAGGFSLAIAADGSAAIGWNYTDAPDLDTEVAAVQRRGLEPFGAPIRLSTVAADAHWFRGEVSVAVDATGDTAVSWSERDTAGHGIAWLSQAAPGEPLDVGKPTTDPDEVVAASVAAIGPDGATTIAYSDLYSWRSHSHLYATKARTVSRAGQISPAQVLRDGAPQSSFAMAADPQGRVTLMTADRDEGFGLPLSLLTWTASPGGRFGDVTMLSSTFTASSPSVAAGFDGSALVAWRTRTDRAVSVTRRAPGADLFDAPQTIVSAAGTVDAPYAGIAASIATTDVATVVGVRELGGGGAQVWSSSTGPAQAVTATPAPQATVAPVLTLGKVTKVGKKPKKGKAVPKGPKLVSVAVSTSAQATVTATITKSSKGVLKGTACVAPPKHPAKGKKKPKSCRRVVVVGTPVRKAVAPGAAVTLTFARRTPTGNYTLTLTAKGTTGLPAKPVGTRLTVK